MKSPQTTWGGVLFCWSTFFSLESRGTKRKTTILGVLQCRALRRATCQAMQQQPPEPPALPRLSAERLGHCMGDMFARPLIKMELGEGITPGATCHPPPPPPLGRCFVVFPAP